MCIILAFHFHDEENALSIFPFYRLNKAYPKIMGNIEKSKFPIMDFLKTGITHRDVMEKTST